MHMPTLLDHFVVALFAVAYPLLGWFGSGGSRGWLNGGARRLLEYRQTMLAQWSMVLLAVTAWIVSGRAWGDLGLGLSLSYAHRGGDAGIGGLWGVWGLAAGAAVGVVVLSLLIWQMVLVERNAAARARARASIWPIREILPHTKREFRWFCALSVTAGVCEELLWRGFLIWYGAAYLGLWGAAGVSIVLFGLAHARLGVSGGAKATGAGAANTGIYLITGSLWIPMILHAATDLTSGRMAYVVLRDAPAGERRTTATIAPSRSAGGADGGADAAGGGARAETSTPAGTRERHGDDASSPPS